MIRAKTGRSYILKTRIINKKKDNILKDLLDLKNNNNKTIATLVFIRRFLYK
jgi:hypothetical protein